MDLPVTSAQVPAFTPSPRWRLVKNGMGFQIQRRVVQPQKWYRRLFGGGREVESWADVGYSWFDEEFSKDLLQVQSRLPEGYVLSRSDFSEPAKPYVVMHNHGRYVAMEHADRNGLELLLRRAQLDSQPEVIAEFP